MNVDANTLNTPELYRLLVGGVTPRPIAWISTVSETGVNNIAPYSFFNVVSVNPPILSYTQVMPQTGEDKDTLRNLIATGECVVHIVDRHLLDQMNQTCASLGPNESEFEFAQLETAVSHSVAPLSVAETPVRYECRFREMVRMGEQPGSGTLVLLDIQHVYVEDRLLADGQIDQRKIDSVGKMGGDFYSHSTDLSLLSRPAL